MKTFDVNSKETIKHANRLEKMHKSDFPIAVRSTLNDLAFDVKQKELMVFANSFFILRNPSFITAHSGVNKASGFDVDSMQSEVGITPRGMQAAANLEIQEKGGTISNRSTIYMDTARVSRDHAKRVRKANYINAWGYIKGKPTKRRSRKSSMVAMAIIAEQQNKLFKMRTKVNETFFRVDRVAFSGTGSHRRVNIRMTPIASYQRGRSVQIEKSPFLETASLVTLNKAPQIFIKNAKKRYERAIRK